MWGGICGEDGDSRFNNVAVDDEDPGVVFVQVLPVLTTGHQTTASPVLTSLVWVLVSQLVPTKVGMALMMRCIPQLAF